MNWHIFCQISQTRILTGLYSFLSFNPSAIRIFRFNNAFLFLFKLQIACRGFYCFSSYWFAKFSISHMFKTRHLAVMMKRIPFSNAFQVLLYPGWGFEVDNKKNLKNFEPLNPENAYYYDMLWNGNFKGKLINFSKKIQIYLWNRTQFT